jgi:hypothetical protein
MKEVIKELKYVLCTKKDISGVNNKMDSTRRVCQQKVEQTNRPAIKRPTTKKSPSERFTPKRKYTQMPS